MLFRRGGRMAMERQRSEVENGIGDSPGEMGGHPRFRVLSEEKIKRIHEATVEILETIGVKVHGQEALDMMADAGCTVECDVVKIPRRLLEDAIASAPKKITIYNREGEEALRLGGPSVYTNTGYTPLEFFDIETGERRDYTLDDFRLVSRVADALPNVDIVGQPGVVRPTEENPLEVINHLEFEAMLTNTSKPIYTLVATGEILNDCFDLAEAVAVANGAKSLREKPFVLAMLNAVSPLVYHGETIDKLFASVDRGIPVICGPMPLAGGTSPVTLAGTIALSNAESLAGLVMSQVRRKGAPYVMITFASTIDMKTLDVATGPEGTLLIAGCIEMGHYYGIPISGGWVGGSERGILDGEAGWEQMLGGLTHMLAGGNAGVGVGAGSSLEACVMADEMLGMLKVMMKGVPVDDETLAVDVIREVGPGGGTFLEHQHTFRHFREHWQPTLLSRMRYEDWVAGGRKSTFDHVKERLQKILRTHQPKPIPEQARKAIDDIIRRVRARIPVGKATS
ncbi:MAG: trimethylamine methyltransferase family protein [Dehalococcoidia bacterium]